MRRLMLGMVAWSMAASAGAQKGARAPGVYAPSRCADVTPRHAADSIDKLVIARMRAERIPGLQLSVLRRGHLETRVYGYADLDIERRHRALRLRESAERHSRRSNLHASRNVQRRVLGLCRDGSDARPERGDRD